MTGAFRSSILIADVRLIYCCRTGRFDSVLQGDSGSFAYAGLAPPPARLNKKMKKPIPYLCIDTFVCEKIIADESLSVKEPGCQIKPVLLFHIQWHPSHIP